MVQICCHNKQTFFSTPQITNCFIIIIINSIYTDLPYKIDNHITVHYKYKTMLCDHNDNIILHLIHSLSILSHNI
ncbi:hypothetical protein NP493_13g01028 [Ridgeia piscesae]|uniref:Uncharacterized protein n=1 Tax=Ridgeia piscesae TaxID=27915 RepID=A0AAD9IRP9_RIDPI|nr:hypothetical protein NP493_6411g00002 [Ridgeia piscesae]KAK2193378.1 hypothetical protein NP493_13g01028 [Ridgeia piscesae]